MGNFDDNGKITGLYIACAKGLARLSLNGS